MARVTVDGVTVDGVTVDGFRDIPAGVYLWGSRQGRTETQAGVARIKDIVITVLSCRQQLLLIYDKVNLNLLLCV